MIIGCVKEVKDNEYRVGLNPHSVRAYVSSGHEVLIEENAGLDSGFSNDEYLVAGAKVTNCDAVFEKSDMIVKVKEPLKSEYEKFREGQILYTYLHLAANKELTQMLLKKKITGIAYETIREPYGLPALAPMSRIAGRLSISESAKYIQRQYGGKGILLSGVLGTNKANVVIIGGGVVGINAAQIAVGLGCHVTVLDISQSRLEYIDHIFDMRVTTMISTREHVLELLPIADVVIGSVLVPGAKAPKMIQKDDLKLMQKGSIITDVAIDQGGCFESSHPTTYSDPVFLDEGIVHYCVANMPGSVSRTASSALNSATIGYGLKIAEKISSQDFKELFSNNAILEGLNTFKGQCVNKAVSEALDLEYVSSLELV